MKQGSFYEKETNLYFDAVEDSNSSIVATANAIKTIVEDPLFSVLKEDSNITHPAR